MATLLVAAHGLPAKKWVSVKRTVSTDQDITAQTMEASGITPMRASELLRFREGVVWLYSPT